MRSLFTTNEPARPWLYIIDSIDRIVKVAGIDHVGLGSDYAESPRSPKN